MHSQSRLTCSNAVHMHSFFGLGPEPVTAWDFQVGNGLFDGGMPRLAKLPHGRTF